MGQQFTSQLDTNPSTAIITQLESRFTILQHPYYSNTQNLKLLNDKTTNMKYILRIITTNNQQQHHKIQEIINKKITNKNIYITNLSQYFFQFQKSYCGNLSKCYLLFDVKQCISSKEYFNIKQNVKDTQEQLIKGFYNLLNGLIWLKNMQTPHGNISTQNIYLIDGQFVLSDPWIAPQGIDLSDRFPSPQKLMKINNKIQDYDPYISDIFSIGMCILQICKKQKLDKIYKKNYTLNIQLLIQQINKLSFLKLKQILKYILLCNQNNRKQFFINYQQKYYIQKQNNKKLGHIKKYTTGLKRINIISNIDNIKNKRSPSINNQNNFHPQQDSRNFSKDNKIYTNIQNNTQKYHIPQNTIYLPNSSPYPLYPPHSQYKPISKQQPRNQINFNIPHPIEYPKNIINQSYSQLSPQNLYKFENKSYHNYIQQPIKFNLISTTNYQIKSNDHKNIIPKFIFDNQTNSVKKINYNQLYNNNYNNQSLEKNLFNNNINNRPNLINLKFQNQITNSENFINNKINITTPIGQKPTHNYNSDSSEFNDYIQNLDQKINRFQMGVSNAIHKTIQQIQNNSQIQKQSQQQIQQNKQKQNSEKNTIQMDQIAQSHLTCQSQVNLPQSCQPIQEIRESQQLNDSLLVEINRHTLQKNENKQNQLDSIVSYGIKNQKIKQNHQLQNVLNSFGIEDQKQSIDQKNYQQNRPTMMHGTQLQTVSNLAIPQEASSQQQSFQSNLQTKQNKGQYCQQYFQNGGVYKGMKINGQRNGQGIFYYRDGGYYKGQWKDNKMNGFGRLYYQSGDLAYQGQWYRDQFHGRGKIYNDNPNQLTESFDYRNFQSQDQYWKYYQGDISCDAKQGHGKLVFSNNEYYVGQFKSDRPNGRGHFYLLNNKIIHGIWSQGRLIKQI